MVIRESPNSLRWLYRNLIDDRICLYHTQIHEIQIEDDESRKSSRGVIGKLSLTDLLRHTNHSRKKSKLRKRRKRRCESTSIHFNTAPRQVITKNTSIYNPKNKRLMIKHNTTQPNSEWKKKIHNLLARYSTPLQYDIQSLPMKMKRKEWIDSSEFV